MSAGSLFQAFAVELRKVFGRGSSQNAAAEELFYLCHKRWSMMNSVDDFRILASWNGWPSAKLVDAILHGLADCIKDLLIVY